MTRPPPTTITTAALACAAVLLACDRQPTRGEAAAAKQAGDEQLLALDYPASKGALPRTIEIVHEGGTGRSLMMLTLTGLPVRGPGASGVTSATLYLTSSYPGRTRPRDNPEGSVDGSVAVRASSAGLLAFSGPPGTIAIGDRALDLRPADGKQHYVSAEEGDGEEIVRFKFPTEHLVAGATAGGFTMSFGRIEIDISGEHHADLREFAARLDPDP